MSLTLASLDNTYREAFIHAWTDGLAIEPHDAAIQAVAAASFDDAMTAATAVLAANPDVTPTELSRELAALRPATLSNAGWAA